MIRLRGGYLSSLVAERTLDVGLCLDILTDPKIFDAISEDGMTVESLKIDVINDYWIAVYFDDLLIGVMQLKQMFNKCFDAHIHILSNYRKKHTQSASKVLWDWIVKHLKGSLIYTTIPVFCPNVRDFLLNIGFEESGYLRKAWLKHGKQNDMWILTRVVI